MDGSRGPWRIAPCPPLAALELAADLGLSRPTAEVLLRRGFTSAEAARAFLELDGSCHDPFLLGDMAAACDAIEAAVAAGRRICVHGDYDVDGIAATALAVLVLRELGADVGWHLPNRFDEGYGLATETVERLAGDGVGLVLTVDCGITAAEQVARAREMGLEVVVSDHHRPGDVLPDCPRVCTRPSAYPFPELCGTGVVYKLAEALWSRRGGDPQVLGRHLDLVALATVADVVPLVGENRALVRAGLRRLARTGKPGLRALMAVARVNRARLSASDVGFRLAPRINAAGRLCHPRPALELLLTEDEGRARALAAELEELNRERQAVEDEILRGAVAQIEEREEAWRARRAYVLSSADWHEGVIGIVASRLVERYCRPVVLVAERGDEAKGSGRSIPAYDLHAGLTAVRHHLTRYGGHRAAAGLSMPSAWIDAFAAELAEHAGERLGEAELEPVHRVDAVVAPAELSLELADELALLEPFGLANPGPTLLAPAARLHTVERMGEGRHLRMTVEGGGFRCRAVAFGQGGACDSLRAPGRFDVAFRLQRNEWNGAAAAQMVVRAVLAVPEAPPPPSGLCATACDLRCGERFVAGRDRAPAAAAAGAGGSFDDRRGAGVQVATIVRLVASGENVLVLVADVARRRGLLTGLLHPGRFGGEAAALFSERCSPAALLGRLDGLADGGTLALADYATAAALPGLWRRFEHVVALDPPAAPEQAALVFSPPQGVHAHLVWGAAEVEVARDACRAREPLRPALAGLWRRRREGGAGAVQAPLPDTVERCLTVLGELGLDAAAPPPAGVKVDLAGSPTYREAELRLQRSLDYLSTIVEPAG